MNRFNVLLPSCRMSVFYFGILFSVIGFVLHFAWEYIQCSPFFSHIKSPPTMGAMVYAAGGDILMMWAVYLMIVLIHRSFTWFQEFWSIKTKFVLVGFSVLLAILVELWALNTERWAYTENNPVLPFLGISILPVLQMALINPFSFFTSKKILTCLAQEKATKKK